MMETDQKRKRKKNEMVIIYDNDSEEDYNTPQQRQPFLSSPTPPTLSSSSSSPPPPLPPPPPLAEAVQPPPLEEWEVWEHVCFCFRKPDSYTMESCLNIAASLSSYYIHVEVCVVDPLGKRTRSLYISRETRVVEFKERAYHGERWEFIWVQMNKQQKKALSEAIKHIMTDEHSRVFSVWNIYLFHLFAMPCYVGMGEPRTRTCTEMTIEILKQLCPNTYTIGSSFAYTPEDVYRLLKELARKKRLKIDNDRTNQNPRDRSN